MARALVGWLSAKHRSRQGQSSQPRADTQCTLLGHEARKKE